MATELSSSTSRAAGQVKVDLGVETKQAWIRWCADRDLVPGKALRTLVERALAEGLELATARSGAVVRVVVASQPDREPKIEHRISFTPSEKRAIEAVSTAQGFGFQDWVIAAVRAALANAPSFGQAELEALTQSNTLLAQVSLDLAALRRGEPATDVAASLGTLEAEIKQHVEHVSAAMAQGARRWQLKV